MFTVEVVKVKIVTSLSRKIFDIVIRKLSIIIRLCWYKKGAKSYAYTEKYSAKLNWRFYWLICYFPTRWWVCEACGVSSQVSPISRWRNFICCHQFSVELRSSSWLATKRVPYEAHTGVWYIWTTTVQYRGAVLYVQCEYWTPIKTDQRDTIGGLLRHTLRRPARSNKREIICRRPHQICVANIGLIGASFPKKLYISKNEEADRSKIHLYHVILLLYQLFIVNKRSQKCGCHVQPSSMIGCFRGSSVKVILHQCILLALNVPVISVE